MSNYVSLQDAPVEAQLFIEEIISVCKKHGFGLLYEGSSFSGEFQILPYDDAGVNLLREASVFLPKTSEQAAQDLVDWYAQGGLDISALADKEASNE